LGNLLIFTFVLFGLGSLISRGNRKVEISSLPRRRRWRDLSLTGFILGEVRTADLVKFGSGGLPLNLQRPGLDSGQRAKAHPGAFRKREETAGGVGNLKASLRNRGSLSFFR
jgi:hypothetical protein